MCPHIADLVARLQSTTRARATPFGLLLAFGLNIFGKFGYIE